MADSSPIPKELRKPDPAIGGPVMPPRLAQQLDKVTLTGESPRKEDLPKDESSWRPSGAKERVMLDKARDLLGDKKAFRKLLLENYVVAILYNIENMSDPKVRVEYGKQANEMLRQLDAIEAAERKEAVKKKGSA